MRWFVDRFRAADTRGRVLLSIGAILFLVVVGYTAAVYGPPLARRVYGWWVQLTVCWAVVAIVVYPFSSSASGKIVKLYFKLGEKLILDPLLFVCGVKPKKEEKKKEEETH
jgi:hypothetical protein